MHTQQPARLQTREEADEDGAEPIEHVPLQRRGFVVDVMIRLESGERIDVEAAHTGTNQIRVIGGLIAVQALRDRGSNSADNSR